MMTSSNQSKLSSIAALAMLAGVSSTGAAQAQGVPTDVIERGNFGLVTQREAGDRDPNGPEFVVRYSTMYRGDYTFNEGDLSGRAIDCDDMVAGPDGNGGLEWKLTGLFVAKSFDVADGSAFDSAFNQSSGAVIGASFINSYKSHVNQAHHPYAEMDAVSGYCNTRFPPSNG